MIGDLHNIPLRRSPQSVLDSLTPSLCLLLKCNLFILNSLMHVFDWRFRDVEVSADHYQRFGFFALKFKDPLLKDFEGFLFFIPIVAVDIDQIRY